MKVDGATSKRWRFARGYNKAIHGSCAIYFPGGIVDYNSPLWGSLFFNNNSTTTTIVEQDKFFFKHNLRCSNKFFTLYFFWEVWGASFWQIGWLNCFLHSWEGPSIPTKTKKILTLVMAGEKDAFPSSGGLRWTWRCVFVGKLPHWKNGGLSKQSHKSLKHFGWLKHAEIIVPYIPPCEI